MKPADPPHDGRLHAHRFRAAGRVSGTGRESESGTGRIRRAQSVISSFGGFLITDFKVLSPATD